MPDPETITDINLDAATTATPRSTLAEVGIDQVYVPQRSRAAPEKLWQKKAHTPDGRIEALHLATGERKFFSGRDWVVVVGVMQGGKVVEMGNNAP